MLISNNWLQSYFEEKLPEPKKLEEIFTMYAFEVEGYEERDGDTVFDLDVLPNRAHDCLSHIGVAKEISTLLNYEMVKKIDTPFREEKGEPLDIEIRNTEICRRYIGKVVEGVKVEQSPAWLKERLEAIGQKSINNIVDATNYIMFETGQPLHAFDKDKLTGNIIVKNAKEGEKFTTLDNKEAVLKESDLVIADDSDALAIAGVKGGKKGEVDESTKNIVLEAANFDPVSIRKTSRRLGVLTDSSKRFENDLSPEIASVAIQSVASLILEIAGDKDTVAYESIDIYSGVQKEYEIEIPVSDVNSVLGTSLSGGDVEDILNRLKFGIQKKGDIFIVSSPHERLDLRIKEDLIEEIGRVYGYKNIEAKLPSGDFEKKEINKMLFYSNKVREVLLRIGYSEIYTSSFSNSGEVELANSLAEDKGFMRMNLSDGMKLSIEKNSKNIPLLGVNDLRIFEIGKVFSVGREYTSLCIAYYISSKKSAVLQDDEINRVLSELEKDIGLKIDSQTKDGIIEIDFEDAISDLDTPNEYGDELTKGVEGVIYQSTSQFPFMLRDIALWVPEDVGIEDVQKIIEVGATDLLVGIKLFDEYKKDMKVSYAYNLVFQSQDRTLTDEEINKIMDKITNTLNEKKDWEVR